MTKTAILNKVHQYVDEADTQVLEVVYKLLEVYRQTNASVLSKEQQKEVIKRSALYKAGKMKTYSLLDARERVRKTISK
ncbi:MAG: hypothetical protein ABI388_03135 [Bacteroidia bacterium]